MTEETEETVEVDLPIVKASELPQYPHGKVGEKEVAKLTKRQLKHIARRSGKTVKELQGMRYYLQLSGRPLRLAYLVVAE